MPISLEFAVFNWILILSLSLWACVYAWILVERENKEKMENKERKNKGIDNEKGVITNE